MEGDVPSKGPYDGDEKKQRHATFDINSGSE